MISFISFFAFVLSPQTFYKEIQPSRENTPFLTPFFDQKYTYIGEGGQLVAFVSEDGTTVLKLFKAQHTLRFKFSRFLHNLTKTQKDWERGRQKWKRKFQETCQRYLWAYTHLQQETGLVYLHFSKTNTPLPVTLIHKKKLTLDLSSLPFVLQKKAELAPNYYRKHPKEAKEALRDLFRSRLKKGFSDPRQTLSKNYGFLEGKAIQIDPGKLEPFNGDKEKELEKIFAHIEEWAERHDLKSSL